MGAVALPVLFDATGAFVAPSVVEALGVDGLSAELDLDWCEAVGLKPEAGSFSVLRSPSGSSVVLVAAGATYTDAASFRLAGAGAVRAVGARDLAFLLPTAGLERPGEISAALVEGALLASYRYRDEGDSRFVVVPIGDPLPSVAAHDAVVAGVRRGVVVAEAVNWAKHLINTPANLLAPRELARAVLDRLALPSVSVVVWDEEALKAERCGGVLGVSAGSAQAPRLVMATYDPEPGAALAHVALVGKGVTFDSGGLSLKPADAMVTMKTDMTGAAVVMASVDAAARLGLRLRVTAIAPMAENVVGPDAVKPGDVVEIRNGLSVEVLNTDAEGRLLLADGLSLAAEAEPDAIVDIATLTGAQRVALGNEVAALYATTDELARLLSSAGARSGESFWRMPLVDAYRSHLDSEVADLANIGKAGQAGSVVAALFLERFTNGLPWAHLDVVGPARAESASGFTTKGGTAFGVRTLIELLSDVATGSHP